MMENELRDLIREYKNLRDKRAEVSKAGNLVETLMYAKRIFEFGERIVKYPLGSDNISFCFDCNNLAHALHENKKGLEALPYIEKAIAFVHEKHASDKGYLGLFNFTKAEILFGLQNYTAALESINQAILLEKTDDKKQFRVEVLKALGIDWETYQPPKKPSATEDEIISSAQEQIAEISEAFEEEIERLPTVTEFFEIITAACCGEEGVLGVTRLEPEFKKAPVTPKKRKAGVADLNDNVFVLTTEFVVELLDAVQDGENRSETLNKFCAILLKGLQQCDKKDIFSGTSPLQVTGIKLRREEKNKIKTKGKIKSVIGDVVQIPAKNGEFFIACVLTKNQFGTAYGIFQGTYPAAKNSIDSSVPILKYPIYSDDVYVSNGRWKIIGNDKSLLKIFPENPEIFHYDPDDLEMGPYGAGETIQEQLRQLSKEEAEELGLLNGKYEQGYLAEYLEEHLNNILI